MKKTSMVIAKGSGGALAVDCRPGADYAGAAAALAGCAEPHLVLLCAGASLPAAAASAARALAARRPGLHVSAVFGRPPGAAAFRAMRGLDFSPYARLGAGAALAGAAGRRLALAAAAAQRCGYRLRCLVGVTPEEAGRLPGLFSRLPGLGIRFALLDPDPGAAFTARTGRDFLKALAAAVVAANSDRAGDGPPRLQLDNTLPAAEPGLAPSDPLLSGGRLLPLYARLRGRAAGGDERAYLRFQAAFAALLLRPALQWTEPSENAAVTRALLYGDIYSQRRFLRRSLPALGSVFLYIPSGCLNDCLFCQRKAGGQRLDLPAVNAFLDSNRAAGQARLSILGNEPLLEPALPRVIARARRGGFSRIELMTSGTLLRSAALCRRLAAAGLTEVSVPLFGRAAPTHDAITRTPGSFAAAVAGIHAARAAGIKVYVHANALRQNLRELPALQAYARRTLKVPFCIFSLRPKGGGAMRLPYRALAPSYAELTAALAGKVSSLLGFPLCVQRRVQGAASVAPGDVADGVKLYMLHQKYYKPPKCGACALSGACLGTFDSYTDIYGDGELEPAA